MYSLSRSALITSLKKATVKKEQRYLNQVMPMFHFFTPRGFRYFSIGTEIEHWPRMGYRKKTNLHEKK